MAIPASPVAANELADDLVHAAVAGPGVLRAHFQPIVDLQRGVVCGYEALSRFEGWGGSPEPIFAAASAAGLSGALEARVIGLALRARRSLGANRFCTVNVTPSALLTPEVARTLDRAGPLDKLVIELTEQTDVDLERLEATLADLRGRGALSAVDDAGSGYGSLQRIAALRPEFVKIDRALITGIEDEPAHLAVVEALGALASSIDAWVVAEGVETDSDLDTLMRLGVPLAQGYHLGRPVPEYTELPAELTGHIVRRRRAMDEGETVGSLVRVAPTLRDDDARLEAPGPARRTTLVVDARGRPVGLVRKGGGFTESTLRVTPDMPVANVARRAMARPERERFDPLVVWSETGLALGIVPVDALVVAAIDED